MNYAEAKDLYSMKLAESIELDNRFVITRVPGGWIYSSTSYESRTAVFVPFDNEFQERKSND